MNVIDETVETTDVDMGERMVRRVYPVARLRESTGAFRLRQAVRGDERANFARFEVGSALDVRVDMDGVAGIGHLVGGAYSARSNGDAVDPTRPFVLRPGEARSWSEDLDLVMVNLQLEALQPWVAAVAGVDEGRVRFLTTAPRSEAAGEHWARTVRYVSSVLTAPDLLSNDLIRGAAIDTLLAAASLTFATSNEALDDTSRSSTGTVRRALAFIDEHADLHISVIDIAEAAHCSVRSLQESFRRSLDTTPLAVLRSARLSRARVDLQNADPDRESVASVARRWGFRNAGRFAAQYRAEIGEFPRVTLQR
jgi:AraC-like DNA-binding protein